MRKLKGVPFVFGVLAAVGAVLALVGCILIGKMTVEIILLVLGMAFFILSNILKPNITIFFSYFCYVIAGCFFLKNQLYTITDVITNIDSHGFEQRFIIAVVGIIISLVGGFVSTIPNSTENKVFLQDKCIL